MRGPVLLGILRVPNLQMKTQATATFGFDRAGELAALCSAPRSLIPRAMPEGASLESLSSECPPLMALAFDFG
jgi:hypothetical protein